jgi:hypothetical protein
MFIKQLAKNGYPDKPFIWLWDLFFVQNREKAIRI